MAIRARVLADRPHHALFGEEHGLVGPAESPWRWIVDPIDGTSNFVRGIPIWATLIALAHDDDGPWSASCRRPALGRRWWAARGPGAFVDGTLPRLDGRRSTRRRCRSRSAPARTSSA